jgi:DMSO/TMAO reductase YedYZ heme-binding membrane subunit
MILPPFDPQAYPPADVRTGSFPQQVDEGEAMGHGGGRTEPAGHGAVEAPPTGHGPDRTQPTGHGGGETPTTGHGGPSPGEIEDRFTVARFTVATGYVATGLLALTLLIGPANLLLRKRKPVSSYLRRDAGMWTAAFSFVHVIYGFQVHGSGQLSGLLSYFVAPDLSPLTNSFGLGNWTGLAAVVIVAGLLALSSDWALRKLNAGRWKWLQRLNYALFALVVLHAFFYGALVRMSSPFTLLGLLTVIAVVVAQLVGIWLWRRSYRAGGSVRPTAQGS